MEFTAPGVYNFREFMASGLEEVAESFEAMVLQKSGTEAPVRVPNTKPGEAELMYQCYQATYTKLKGPAPHAVPRLPLGQRCV